MIYRVNKLDVAELNRVLELIQGSSSSNLSDLNTYIRGVESKLSMPTAYGGATDVNDMKGLLDAIDDDDVLTKAEKRILVPMIDGFIDDRAYLQPQAEALGFVPAIPDQYKIWTDYSGALDDLIGFLEAYGKNQTGVWKWSDTLEDLPLGTGNGKMLWKLRMDYAQKYAILRAALWGVTFEVSVTADLASSTAVQAAQDAPKVVNGLPTLPNALYPTGKLVYDTVTKRLYRSAYSASHSPNYYWESATVAAGDIVDQLTAEQIHSIKTGAFPLNSQFLAH